MPAKHDTLFITLSATGDQTNQAAACFTAKVDGDFANPGGQGFARCATDELGNSVNVPGWVALQKTPSCNIFPGAPDEGVCPDNSIHYEWCTHLKGEHAVTSHTVEIRMASAHAGDTVFIEQAQFYVDSANLPGMNSCGDATPDDGS